MRYVWFLKVLSSELLNIRTFGEEFLTLGLFFFFKPGTVAGAC